MRLMASGAFVLAILLPASAPAQELPPEAGAARTAAMFEVFCYRQLPHIDKIASLASAGNFLELEGAELERYKPAAPADEVRAWRFQDLGSDFVLASSVGKPEEQVKTILPQFADSTSYACSLFVDSPDDPDEMMSEMRRMIGRGPDEQWQESVSVHVHMWCGRTEALFSCVYFYSPPTGGAGGMLSAIAYVKNS